MPTLDQATQPVDRSGLTPVAVSVAAPAALYRGTAIPTPTLTLSSVAPHSTGLDHAGLFTSVLPGRIDSAEPHHDSSE